MLQKLTGRMRGSSFMFYFQILPLGVVLHTLIYCAFDLRQNSTQLGNIIAFCSITLLRSLSVRQFLIYKRFCGIFTEEKKTNSIREDFIMKLNEECPDRLTSCCSEWWTLAIDIMCLCFVFSLFFCFFPYNNCTFTLPIELDWAQTEKGQEHPPSP